LDWDTGLRAAMPLTAWQKLPGIQPIVCVQEARLNLPTRTMFKVNQQKIFYQ
jgi:hypothetical protein